MTGRTKPRGGKSEAEPASSLTRVIGAVVKGLWMLFVIATPFVGAWVASSLAAYSNRSVGWAAASGLLLFPVLPLAWEAYAGVRRRRQGVTKRFLTFADRLTLRTLAINLVFLAGVLATHPESAFVALSTRGDWMLEGRHSAHAEQLRRGLFAAAGGLEWLYRASRPNPYRDPHDEETPPTVPSAAPAPSAPASTSPAPTAPSAPTPSASTSAQPAPPPPPPPTPAPASPTWPLPPTLDPVVAAMPREAETSIAAVAHYIADRVPEPFARVKALHDWVADRIAYDAPAFLDDHVTQDDAEPEIVFRNRLGVCAGYAKVLQALGKAVGIDIAYVTGDARIPGKKDVQGASHAWNAVTIGGRAYLIDATWDAGSLDGRQFRKGYGTDYLFAPPQVFGLEHQPDKPAWQLREHPLSTGDFLRQPMLDPGFYRRGLVLVEPLQPQVTTTGALDVTLQNPRGVDITVSAQASDMCRVTREPSSDIVHARCALPQTRTYTVLLFAGEPETGSESSGLLTSVGQIEANNRL